MEKKTDKQTMKVMKEGEQLLRLVEDEKWMTAKRLLYKQILEVGNILAIETKENALVELAARQMAITMVFEWIKEVEGSALAHKANAEMFREIQENSHVMYLGEEE